MRNITLIAAICILPAMLFAADPIIKIGRATTQQAFRDAVKGDNGGIVNPPPVIPPPPPGTVKDFGPELRNLFEEEWKDSKGKTLKLPWSNQVLNVWPIKNPTTGVYGTRHVKIEALTDCVIDLNGCTIKTELPSTILLLEALKNVTIRNGKLEGSVDLATSATWEASKRQFLVDPGMPLGKQVYTVGTIPEPVSGSVISEKSIYREAFIQDETRHRGSPDKYGTYKLVDRAWVWLSGEVPDFPNGAKVHIQLENNSGHAIRPDNEEFISGLTIEDITLCNIPGMAISGEHDGNVIVRRVKFERLPGAILAVASDGIHFDNSKPGVLIEDCNLSFINDDFVNCNAKAGEIVNITGNTITVSQIREASGAINIGKWCDAGERMVFSTKTTYHPADKGTVIVAKSTTRSTEKAKAHTFTLDRVTGLAVGMICVNADRVTGSVIVRNNRFHSTRATGVKARSSNFQIFNNAITDCKGTAIRFDSFTERGEGTDSRDIEAWNNIVTGSGVRDDIVKVGDKPSPYYVDQDSFPAENITVWSGNK